MRVRLIIRVLDAEGELLGWASLPAQARGDRCLRALEPCILVPTRDGEAAVLSVHWPDLHVQQRAVLQGHLTVGQPITLTWPDAVVMRFPSDDGPLPAVTVGQSVVVTPPAGVLGARGN